MRAIVQSVSHAHSPESLTGLIRREPGTVLLRSGLFDPAQGRYSLVTARPFLVFRSSGSRCELISARSRATLFGDPWRILARTLARYELLEELDSPFPLGGAFGYWGYDLKRFLEPCLTRSAVNDLELPDSHIGFYDSLVVFDHMLGTCSVVSTGLREDGARCATHAQARMKFWLDLLEPIPSQAREDSFAPRQRQQPTVPQAVHSTLSRAAYLDRVKRAQAYIRSGDIYQVNLARRLSVQLAQDPWHFFLQLKAESPAPFSAFLDAGDFQVVSSSPESFLGMSGSHVRTRPIKGTRPRSSDPVQDTRLAFELQTSGKELSELVMITDLLRNDLGRVCEFGSVEVPELFRLERYAHVQHLVSTVEGQLRPSLCHLDALAACFPGGSITGAPKIRAMQIIDELEPVTRGPYTGALGYLGFNRESQLNILIRTAICLSGMTYFHTGAGIVAESEPEAEYEETCAKARGFLRTMENAALAAPNLTQPTAPKAG